MDFEAAISHGGETFDADYLNWGVRNGCVILVGFDNAATDNAEKAKLEEWFPDRDVYVIEMLESWIAGGGVHCHTNDQPAASTLGTPPTADFTVASAIASAPFEAHFIDLSTENPTAWAWSFGDGGSSTDRNSVHIYDAEGTYTVSLTARSASGADTTVGTDYISVPEPGALLQLGFGCLGLWALNLRRQTPAFRTERERRSVRTTFAR